MKNHNKMLALAVLATALAAPAFADSLSITIGTPPPAPIVEAVPASPGPGYVWLPGYWTWANDRHMWVAGRWAQPPHPGAVWDKAHWEHDKGGYHLHHGGWK